MLYYIYHGEHMFAFLFMLVNGCSSDISVIKRDDDEVSTDTSVTSTQTGVDTTPPQTPKPTPVLSLKAMVATCITI